jgi:hypothetical protein
MKGSLIQVEQEKLTHISFIKEGEAEYILQRYNNQPYLICSEGDHFGVLDIVFRFREQQKIRVKKQNERRMKKAKRLGTSEYTDTSSSETNDEEDFALLTMKIKCKFTIRARMTCYLLQMEKQALNKMRLEFPEVFETMMAEEFKTCMQSLTRKAKLITEIEKKKRDKI